MMVEDSDVESRINSLLVDPDFLRLANLQRRPNLFATVAASHTEMWHSAFIKWLLDPRSHIGLGSFPLKRFLFAILKYGRSDNVSIQRPALSIAEIEEMQLDSMEFETEFTANELKSPKGGRGRIDIVASSENIKVHSSDQVASLRIILENKVRAEESKDQTQAYYDYGQRSSGNFNYDVYIFLTPDESQFPNCEHFLQFTYQQLLDYVIKPCIMHPDLPDESRYLLEQYMLNLGKPLRGVGVMAMPNRELCRKIYESHKQVLDEIFVSVRNEAPSHGSTTSRSNVRTANTTLTDLFRGKLLNVTDKLIGEYRGKRHEALLNVTPDSQLIIIYDSQQYFSPSPAASAVTGSPINGWSFWSVYESSGKNKGTLAALRGRLSSPSDQDAQPQVAGRPALPG